MSTASNGSPKANEILISSDSHVIEPAELLKQRVATAFRDRAPLFKHQALGGGFQGHPGGGDPNCRIKEMETDGLSAEVLYPTYILDLFAMDDAQLQAACFRAYNDWLTEYCQAAPQRLFGIAAISVYDIEDAVKELERCKKAGMKGSIIWQVPHPKLPFNSDHYDKLWAASQDLDMPVSLHILTGYGYHMSEAHLTTVERYRGSVITKYQEIAGALFELMFYGAFERYPGLKFVTVENEVGWIPFTLQQWDYYYGRHYKVTPSPIRDQVPSEVFGRHVFATFFRDQVGGHNFEWWGNDNCMWSTDYPHGNSTWPHSREIMERNLARLSPEQKYKLVCGNVAKLYDIEVPQTAHEKAAVNS